MNYIFSAFFFLLGAIVGSFLNVLILRYGHLNKSRSRSNCFVCGHQLSFYDLIPILSFFLLAGRCRYCKSRLSFQYPLIEALTAITFLSIYLKLSILGPELIFYFIVWSILIVIFVYDFRHKIIPNGLVYTLIILSLAKVLFIAYPDFGAYSNLLLSGPVAASPFAFLWLISSGRLMGFGDAKLSLALGWLLGPGGAFSAIVFAFWIGALVGLALIFLSKLNFFNGQFLLSSFRFPTFHLTIKSEIPFAPFLVIGTALVFFGGADIFKIVLF